MKTLLIAIVILTGLASTANATRPAYICTVTPDPAVSTPDEVALHVTGTVPRNSSPYLRVDGSQEWTGLHNIKGTIDDWTGRTTAELPSGTTHTAEILDYRASPADASVIATCTFTT